MRELPKHLFYCVSVQSSVSSKTLKVFSEKASAIARMRQKCVKHASDMCQNESCFIGKRGTFQNASKLRQKCVTNARNTFGGEHPLDDTEIREGWMIRHRSLLTS